MKKIKFFLLFVLMLLLPRYGGAKDLVREIELKYTDTTSVKVYIKTTDEFRIRSGSDGNHYWYLVQPVQVGDILYFGFQTAVITHDNEPLGFLNDTDIIIHTYHRAAEERAFSELPYKDKPYSVYRWKPDLKSLEQ